MFDLSSEEKRLIKRGDLATLAQLDQRGLLLGPGENSTKYFGRLKALQKNLKEFFDELHAKKEMDFYGIKLSVTESMDITHFDEAGEVTEDKFAFRLNWAPGFCNNETMGLLFAGCALMDNEKPFVLFLIRKAFAKQPKWFVYSRKELLAHESTHIAHMAYKTPDYEEFFAYQTSSSLFRRAIGGLFRSPRDTYSLLFCMLSMPIFQILNLLEVTSFNLAYVAIILYIWPTIFLLQYIMRMKMLAGAIRKMESVVTESKYAGAVLFRMTSCEIETFAHVENPVEWINEQKELRWDLIRYRFIKKINRE
ncbi:MAG: hypothetical protein MK193_13750 [Lentisphaeria bacterium]|nr:hypothetical protein [Lentisphaeria bacterium]